MRNKEDQYATSNTEISIELLTSTNVVTQCTLRNILKGRAKRGDMNALDHYIRCALVIMADTPRVRVYEIAMGYIQPYYDELDKKKREVMTNFEDFENAYFWRPYDRYLGKY